MTLFLGAKVYVKVFVSDVDRRLVDACGKISSINKKTITVLITWKTGKTLAVPEVRRIPLQYITKVMEEN